MEGGGEVREEDRRGRGKVEGRERVREGGYRKGVKQAATNRLQFQG